MSEYKKKIVLLPIEVPDNSFCWNGINSCEHFDNYGGHEKCELGIARLARDQEGRILKPAKCLLLSEE